MNKEKVFSRISAFSKEEVDPFLSRSVLVISVCIVLGVAGWARYEASSRRAPVSSPQKPSTEGTDITGEVAFSAFPVKRMQIFLSDSTIDGFEVLHKEGKISGIGQRIVVPAATKLDPLYIYEFNGTPFVYCITERGSDFGSVFLSSNSFDQSKWHPKESRDNIPWPTERLGADPNALKIGHVYKADRPLRLMPLFIGDPAVRDVKEADKWYGQWQELPAGGMFHVFDTKYYEGKRWYQVTVSDGSKDWTMWTYETALLGNKLEDVTRE